jgi:hypothetical protein
LEAETSLPTLLESPITLALKKDPVTKKLAQGKTVYRKIRLGTGMELEGSIKD